YLTYLRDRLLLARELLTDSGSILVQISDENVHHVREIMDEVFGKDNFCSVISFRKKTMPLGSKFLESISDFIIWYFKSKPTAKYHSIFSHKNIEGDSHWNYIEMPDGTRRKLSGEEINNHKRIPKGARIFQLISLYPAGLNQTGLFPVTFRGKIYKPPAGKSWGTNPEGMQKLIDSGRIEPYEDGTTLRYVLFLDDYSITPLTTLWCDSSAATDMRYVVQTNEKVISRCLLMTTDPGDLVLDPTCGSGTTAFVAEQWGRRWITCDTSRVAVTLAKQRIMTSLFEYYELQHPEEGIGSGFRYKTVPHLTLKSITNSEPASTETLY